MSKTRMLPATILAITIAAPACAPQQVARPAPAVVRSPAPRYVPPAESYVPHVPWGERTIGPRMDQIGERARQRWQRWFQAAGVSWPARRVVLVGLKREKLLEVYAGPSRSRLSFVRRIPMTAASGGPGPKLREGDGQVPEGIYEVDRLNPYSAYHVSMHLAYPNAFDEQMARADGRRRLGGQIMIHGNAKSIGCIAVGDEAAEDLFVLTADAGVGSTEVILVPRDFRRTRERDLLPGQPAWVAELYARLDRELQSLPPREPSPVVASRAASEPQPAVAVPSGATKPAGPTRIYANELDARRRARAAERRIVVPPRTRTVAPAEAKPAPAAATAGASDER